MWNIVVSYDYDSFGNFEITSWTDNWNTRLYTGREFDGEIWLYYLRARYYNSELGRFISRDPIDIADDVNLYAYVGNSPVSYTDPLWTEKKWIRENEGNAWYFESMDLVKWNSWHAAMYFIYWWNEYLINYNPWESIWFNPLGDWDMFLWTVWWNSVWTLWLNEYKYMIKNWEAWWYWITKIESKYINTWKLAEWYDSDYQDLPRYNTFTNNCSDEVEKALEYAWFFNFTEINWFPSLLPWVIPLPWTNPGWLWYDIKLELNYKKIWEKIINLAK